MDFGDYGALEAMVSEKTCSVMLETIQGESSAVKLIENGILYIIRDGVKYTVLGTTVRSNVH